MDGEYLASPWVEAYPQANSGCAIANVAGLVSAIFGTITAPVVALIVATAVVAPVVASVVVVASITMPGPVVV